MPENAQDVVESPVTHARRSQCALILTPTYVFLLLAALPVQTKIPFAAYMPLSLAVVDDGEVRTAVMWKMAVGTAYLALGLVALIRRSILGSLLVPGAALMAFPIFLLRYYAALGHAFR